jgi:hypothetical protein
MGRSHQPGGRIKVDTITFIDMLHDLVEDVNDKTRRVGFFPLMTGPLPSRR